jgi:hypothetical protein
MILSVSVRGASMTYPESAVTFPTDRTVLFPSENVPIVTGKYNIHICHLVILILFNKIKNKNIYVVIKHFVLFNYKKCSLDLTIFMQQQRQVLR